MCDKFVTDSNLVSYMYILAFHTDHCGNTTGVHVFAQGPFVRYGSGVLRAEPVGWYKEERRWLKLQPHTYQQREEDVMQKAN